MFSEGGSLFVFGVYFSYLPAWAMHLYPVVVPMYIGNIYIYILVKINYHYDWLRNHQSGSLLFPS